MVLNILFLIIGVLFIVLGVQNHKLERYVVADTDFFVAGWEMCFALTKMLG